jgi:polysaccharide biosynthesis protein PslG
VAIIFATLACGVVFGAAQAGAANDSAATLATRPLGSAAYGLVGFNGNFVPGGTVAERTANYRKLYAAGVRTIRLGFDWFYLEPPGAPLHDYAFAGIDREIQAVTDAGLRVIGLLAYGHPDYSTNGGAVYNSPARGGLPPFYVFNTGYFPPDKPADFTRYTSDTARHVEQRFPGKVVGWEVWNEQNEGWRFWPPREDPAAYARLLCAARDSLKGVDASIPVLYGGVFFPAIAELPGTSGPTFLEQTYRANRQLGRCFDALAYHPYPYPFTAPELDVPVRGSVLSAADQMHAVLVRHGDGGKPLWITEVGWPTHDRSYGVSEEKQAQYVARMQAATFAQRLPVLTWYTYGDYQDPSGFNQEAWFGFFRPDGSPKPSYTALRTFGRVFDGMAFKSDLSRALGLPPGQLIAGGRGFALEYGRRGERVVALWLANESGAEGQGGGSGGGMAAPKSLRVSLPVASKTVTITDYLGRSRSAQAAGGKLALEIGPSPQYVVDRLPGAASCLDRVRPESRFSPRRDMSFTRTRVDVGGRSSDRSCGGKAGKVTRVDVAIIRGEGGDSCRFLRSNGRLGPPVSCRRTSYLRAGGTARWHYRHAVELPRGQYVVRVRATDLVGNRERQRRIDGNAPNLMRFSLR